MNEPLKSGLWAGQDGKERPVPLAGVHVRGELAGPCAQVTVTQRYVNREKKPVEALYVFPLPEGAAVCGFEAVVGDRVIRGHVEERERAIETYDDALAAGHGAFLLEQERPNIFTASVGNLRPGETADVRISYVELLAREGDAWRFTVPTTVSPRYVPPKGRVTVGQPEAERVDPPRAFEVPYGLRLELDVDAAVPLRAVESPSHPVRVTRHRGATRVELSSETVAMDRDFVLLVTPEALPEASSTVAVDADGVRYARVTFRPRFDTAEPEDPDAKKGHEVLFLVDCSGSMGGDSIEQARQALRLCVRALHEGDRFDVIRFGSTHQALWGRARAYGAAQLSQAEAFIEATDADLGGTEIREPLEALLRRKPDPQRSRRILLLTDGQVGNEDELIELCRKHADDARVFTFGLGAGASEHLVRGVARATGGMCEMIFPGERLAPKVLRTFHRVRCASVGKVSVDWGGLVAEQAPATVGPVYDGDEVTVFARLGSAAAARKREKPDRELVLVADGRRFPVTLRLDEAVAGGPVPLLWARHRIRDLEPLVPAADGTTRRLPKQAQAARDELVALGTRYGLVSAVTSYVAVDERPDGAADGPAEVRRVPVALTAGWGGAGRLQPRMAMGGIFGAAAFGAVSCCAPVMRAGAQVLREASLASFGKFAHMADAMPREPASPPVATDWVVALLLTQRPDGSFPWSDALRTQLGARAARLERAAETHGEALAVTTVVVALLAAEAADRRDEWLPAVTKARRWLSRQPSPFDPAGIL